MTHADYAVLAGPSGAGTFAFAEPIRPNFIFASGTPHELHITPDGIKFRGEAVTDAGQLYHALTAAMGKGAESVTFFRNRGPGGTWVEADAAVIDIIQHSPSRDMYELRTMHSRPNGQVEKGRLEQIARDCDLQMSGELYAFAVAVRAEP